MPLSSVRWKMTKAMYPWDIHIKYVSEFMMTKLRGVVSTIEKLNCSCEPTDVKGTPLVAIAQNVMTMLNRPMMRCLTSDIKIGSPNALVMCLDTKRTRKLVKRPTKR